MWQVTLRHKHKHMDICTEYMWGTAMIGWSSIYRQSPNKPGWLKESQEDVASLFNYQKAHCWRLCYDIHFPQWFDTSHYQWSLLWSLYTTLCFSGRTAVVYTGARNKLAMACSHTLLLLRWMLHSHYLQMLRFLHIMLHSHQMLRFTHRDTHSHRHTPTTTHTLCHNISTC